MMNKMMVWTKNCTVIFVFYQIIWYNSKLKTDLIQGNQLSAPRGESTLLQLLFILDFGKSNPS